MKFQSIKDRVLQIITFGFAVIFIGVAIVILVESGLEGRSSFLSSLLILSVAGFLLWLYYDTAYELTSIELKYKSGPIRGTI
tara:strand:- start:1047 stop:1292 length:246 start_codon:yes stop_codon:yes gene_type:complete